MRGFLLAALIGFTSALRSFKRTIEPPSYVKVEYDEQWFQQQLDHFDIVRKDKWDQRYWVNMDEYEEGGPALIFIGGEGEANPKWLNFGNWYTIAKENKAAMFLLEHRFYGQSWPTENMSTENLRFLSSRQGLEDLATFMAAMTSTYNLTGPWVSFGGSYPGSMSAWLKLKYPHLLAGAVSSSGPLFAKLDFFEYFEVVRAAFDTTGPGCNEALSGALDEIENLLQNEAEWGDISAKFKTCNIIDGNNSNDVKSFLDLLVDNLAGIVQYNGRTEKDINFVCNLMQNDTLGTVVDRLSVLSSLSFAEGQECLDHEFSSYQLKDTSFSGTGVGWRPWLWQTCTEFGWYQTTNHGIYGSLLDLDFFKSWCIEAYSEVAWNDERFDKEMINTNTEYGGFSPVIENVVFVHGSIDPWHAMGVLENLNEMAPSIYIEGTSHCADMYEDASGDSEGLKNARSRVRDLVKTWIA